jgi:nicotinate-nucleotide adenylyltransferase
MISEVEWLYGGSFDPLHLGHTNVIRHLIETCPERKVRLLPCAVPALKKRSSATFNQRVEMLGAELGDNPQVIVDPREGLREGPSFTVDSLIELKREFPRRCFILVIGSDNLVSLKNWNKVEQLAKLCHIAVVNRPGSDSDNAQEHLQAIGFNCTKNVQQLAQTAYGRYYSLSIEEHDISSTIVKKRIKDGLALDLLVPNSILEYIKQNLIYQ